MGKIQENINNRKVDLSFRKEERLCSKKVIDKLFSEGKSFLVFPLKIVFLNTTLPNEKKVQAALTVGKRNFKKAVQRNKIKRRMREAYRLNKHILYQNLNTGQLAIFVVFIGKEIPGYNLIEAAVKRGINRLVKEISTNN